MKTLILLFTIPFILFASGKTLSTSDYMYLSNIDKQPFKRTNKQSRINQIDKINEDQAKAIIKKLTQEDTQSIKLTRRGKYLLYKISTQNHTIVINALDGTLIKQELKGGM